jgi:cellulose synthase/poly-beta-1,6-N-acetylglucosamine synthase-like glycosyltransferase
MLGLAACLAVLLPATAACLSYLVPTVVGLLRGTHVPRLAGKPLTFAVLIPAHNEEQSLPAALRSLAAQDYPADRLRVTVVADNCTDRTDEAATGTTCLVRHDPKRPGKGRAVAFGLERILADRPDAVLVLDADCELNPDALRHLNAAFAAGAVAVQATVRSRNADVGPAGYVAAVGAAVDAAVAAGRDRLGLSVPLRGTGMAFRRELLERIPWEAYGPVEDAEYAARLRAAGVRVRFCGGAVVACDAPAAVEELCRQRRRWRAAAGFLSSKPLVLIHLAATVAACAAFGIWVWPLMLVLLTAGLYLRAMAEVGLTRRRVRLLLGSAGLVARLGWLTLAGRMRPAPGRWESA